MLCMVVKDYYFCTRIRVEVLPQTDSLPKSKQTFQKSSKKIWIIKSKGSIFADPKRKNWEYRFL